MLPLTHIVNFTNLANMCLDSGMTPGQPERHMAKKVPDQSRILTRNPLAFVFTEVLMLDVQITTADFLFLVCFFLCPITCE